MPGPTSPRIAKVRAVLLAAVLPPLVLSACTIEVDAADHIPKCVAGMRRCSGTTVEICPGDEKGFEVLETCGPTQLCREAACVEWTGLQPAPEPDAGGIGDGDAAPWSPPVFPPVDPPASVIGNTIKARAVVEVVEALPGGTVDVGLCAGAAAHSVSGGVDVCAGSVFVRIEQGPLGLQGQLYRHEAGKAPNPLLTDPMGLEVGEAYELRFEDYAGDGSWPAEVSLLVTLSGLFTKTGVTQTVLLPPADLNVFGLWNMETAGSSEEALEGAVSGVELATSGQEPMALSDFQQLASESGDIMVSPDSAPVISFYVTNDRVGSLQLKVPKL